MAAACRAGLAVALVLLFVGPSLAGDLSVEAPWTRATPAGASVASGYATIVNHGTAADRLTGAALEAADRGDLHTMQMADGVMTMRAAGPLEVPPGGTLVLSPGGFHIMFTGLHRRLAQGGTVHGSLTFEHAGTLPVVFAIEGVGAKGPAAGAMPAMDMSGATMPGMAMPGSRGVTR